MEITPALRRQFREAAWAADPRITRLYFCVPREPDRVICDYVGGRLVPVEDDPAEAGRDWILVFWDPRQFLAPAN